MSGTKSAVTILCQPNFGVNLTKTSIIMQNFTEADKKK